MITEWFAEVGMDIAILIATMMPEYEIPAWMLDHRNVMENLLQSYVGLGVWVDWFALGICLAAVGATYGIGLLVKLIRAVIAHVPQFGGSGG